LKRRIKAIMYSEGRVAPRRGAWIETFDNLPGKVIDESRAPQGRVD